MRAAKEAADIPGSVKDRCGVGASYSSPRANEFIVPDTVLPFLLYGTRAPTAVMLRKVDRVRRGAGARRPCRLRWILESLSEMGTLKSGSSLLPSA